MANATSLLEQLRVQKEQLTEKMKALKVEQKATAQKVKTDMVEAIVKTINAKKTFQVDLMVGKKDEEKEKKTYTAVEFDKELVYALTSSGKNLARITQVNGVWNWYR